MKSNEKSRADLRAGRKLTLVAGSKDSAAVSLRRILTFTIGRRHCCGHRFAQNARSILDSCTMQFMRLNFPSVNGTRPLFQPIRYEKNSLR